MHVGPPWLLAISIVGLAGAPVATGQKTPSPAALEESGPPAGRDARFQRLRRWLEAVEQHEPGSADAPAVWIGALPRPELLTLHADVEAMLDAVHLSGTLAARLGLADHETAMRAIRRGALLHADAGMLAPDLSGRVEGPLAPDAAQLLFWVADGRHEGFGPSPLHWDLARALLGGVRPAPPRDEMVRLWYVATAAYLQSHERLGELMPHLERARELFPSDAGVWLYAGCLHETQAAPRFQAALRSVTPPPGFDVFPRSSSEELELAERHFRRALKHAPGLTEARVRLAHVIGALARHEEAAAELRQIVADRGAPVMLYFANLFLGREEQALDDRAAARRAFERAAVLFPEAQSPRLALGRLAWRSGDRSGALDALSPLWALPPDADARADPWWEYYTTHVPSAEELLADLRRPFLDGR